MAGIPAAPRRRRGPFIGPRPFDAHDESLFLGRERDIALLLTLWRRNRLTILHSDAAAGKTSLLRAGLIPRLHAGNASVMPLGHAAPCRVWPAAALPGHNPYVLALLSSWDAEETLGRLAAQPIEEFVRRRAGFDRNGEPAPVFAAIDQAETFLRRRPADHVHRRRFLRELFDALAHRPDLRLLLSVRTDYLDDLRHEVKLANGPEHAEYTLGPFTPETAAFVLVRSAQATLLRVPRDEVEELLTELRTIRDDAGEVERLAHAVDPLLLQIAAARVWGGPPPHRRLGPARLRAEVEHALRDWCGRVLAETAAEHELAPRHVESWLRGALLRTAGSAAPATPITDAFLHTLEDRQLIADGRHDAGPELPRPRLRAPLRRLDAGQWPAGSPGPAALLRAAVRARAEDEPGRAARLARRAAGDCPPGEMRIRAEIESLLGTLAYEQGLLEEAVTGYRGAANLYEAMSDGTAVGWALAAIGRIRLAQGRRSTAIEHLMAAVSRVPNDPLVQTGLGQALRASGQTGAALDVLVRVLERDEIPEARRAYDELLGGPDAS
ncbi:nSTAND1 domain-containing NTPase [Nonomuraea candida]|uniref:nSTAND1 domain-containing NTPase n=1 Tax=Nonomuraea candida TaxID=359159 RepID=UPI0006950B2C|nr:tetratricopeptide repeat protein [Nonomuraea candida]